MVKAGDLDIAREVVKINDKMFESVNFEYLKREDIVITKEDINLLLNNGTPYFTKVIIVDNNELVFDYNQKLILDSLMKKVDKKTKEYILNNFYNLIK